MTITHEERSHDVARTHKMWPGFGGYESHGRAVRHGSLPPYDADASAPGIIFRREKLFPRLKIPKSIYVGSQKGEIAGTDSIRFSLGLVRIAGKNKSELVKYSYRNVGISEIILQRW